MILFISLLTLSSCLKEDQIQLSNYEAISVDTGIPYSISSTGAKINVSFSSSYYRSRITYGICLDKKGNPLLANSILVSSDNGPLDAVTYTLSNLLPNTTYYIRGYATEEHYVDDGYISDIVYGDIQKFTTSIETTTPVLTTISATNITTTTATCGGNITSDGGLAVTARGVCWSTSGSPTVNLSTKTVEGSGGGIFSSSISNLSPKTIYYYRAYATNSKGTSYGALQSFITLSLTIPVLSTNDVTSVTASTAICGGNITSDGGTPVTARGVCWSTSSNPTVLLSAKTVEGSGVGSFTSKVTGLNFSTTYYIRAYATNSIGTSYGSQQVFTTPRTVKIITGTASSVLATSFIVSATIQNSDLASEWGIVMGLTDPLNPASGTFFKFSSVADGSASFSFVSKAANTKYYYCAYAKLKTGEYVYGDISWVRTASY